MGVELIDLPRHSDDRGHLVALTGSREVPFEIRRVFYIFGNTAGRDRAGHASRVTSELLVALHGSVRAVVADGLGEGLDLVRDFAAALGPFSPFAERAGIRGRRLLDRLSQPRGKPAWN